MAKIKITDYKIITLSLVAAVIYNSWPLGYWLNQAASRSSLASGLEASGQPYNWLFIGGDIASSLLIIIFCWVLWRRSQQTKQRQTIKLVLIFVALFAVGTIADALLPEGCVPNLQRCASFTQDHLLLIHGVFSILASMFLFVSLAMVWFGRRRNLILSGLLIGYVIFGLVSLVEAVAPGNNGNWSQHYYITLCSVWLVCVPYAVSLLASSSKISAKAP